MATLWRGLPCFPGIGLYRPEGPEFLILPITSYTCFKMSDPTKIILEWLKLPTQHLVTIFLFLVLVFGVLIFASDGILDDLGLRDFRSDYRGLLGLGLIFSSTALVVRFITWALEPFTDALKERRSLKRRHQRLHDLTPRERTMLRPYINDQTRTQYLNPGSGIVSGLASVRIIYRASNMGDYNSLPYNLQPWAWDYLNKHPELLADDSPPPTP